MKLKVGKETVLVISDMQCPFEHPDSIKFLSWIKKRYKPTKIVNIGDEVDFHALSKYFKDPDGYSAGHELKHAKKSLKPLYKLFPKVQVCTSNHVDRPYIRAFEAGLPKSFIKDISEVLEAPKGWQWADKWELDGVTYIHGHVLPGGKHSIQRAVNEVSGSVVFGHVHAHAGVYYKATAEELTFGMNVGCLIDTKAYAFVYGKKYVNKPIIGCGIVHKGLPQFIPMLLNKRGRWVGEK